MKIVFLYFKYSTNEHLKLHVAVFMISFTPLTESLPCVLLLVRKTLLILCLQRNDNIFTLETTQKQLKRFHFTVHKFSARSFSFSRVFFFFFHSVVFHFPNSALRSIPQNVNIILTLMRPCFHIVIGFHSSERHSQNAIMFFFCLDK